MERKTAAIRVSAHSIFYHALVSETVGVVLYCIIPYRIVAFESVQEAGNAAGRRNISHPIDINRAAMDMSTWIIH